jgi:glycerol kinase
MSKFMLAIEQATTSSRAIIFDHKGDILSVAQKGSTQIYPTPGWVEHDPKEIWTSQASVVAEAILKAGLQPADIARIGITNLRETTVVWIKKQETLYTTQSQIQADILNAKVVRPQVIETTAMGAAYLAGLAVGYRKNVEEIKQQWKLTRPLGRMQSKLHN